MDWGNEAPSCHPVSLVRRRDLVRRDLWRVEAYVKGSGETNTPEADSFTQHMGLTTLTIHHNI